MNATINIDPNTYVFVIYCNIIGNTSAILISKILGKLILNITKATPTNITPNTHKYGIIPVRNGRSNMNNL